jgi:putative peptidoglycan lipid II flippase
VLLSYPIIALIYGLKGDDITATASALAAFATGIPAYVLGKVFVTGFFARQDTTTPVKIALVSITCNIILNMVLMGPFSHVGLAMATSVAAWVNTGLQLFILHRRGWFSLTRHIRITAVKVSIAASVMGGGLWLARYHWLPVLPETLLLKIAYVIGLITCSILVFGSVGQLTGAFNLNQIRQSLKRG